jgi:HSP20 family protein
MAYEDIFREMENLRSEVDRAFRGFGLGRLFEPAFMPALGIGEYPHLNVSEDENNLYVEAVVPGIEPQDINLNVMKGTVTLAGERREVEAGQKTWFLQERGAGKFVRAVELPTAVNSENVNAQCKNGILTVTLPKAEEAKPKKISVQAS